MGELSAAKAAEAEALAKVATLEATVAQLRGECRAHQIRAEIATDIADTRRRGIAEGPPCAAEPVSPSLASSADGSSIDGDGVAREVTPVLTPAFRRGESPPPLTPLTASAAPPPSPRPRLSLSERLMPQRLSFGARLLVGGTLGRGSPRR